MDGLLFSRELAERSWCTFEARGFERPVAGLVHRASSGAVNGMPLGGIGTGCTDLEINGTLGFTTIFNSLMPRRGPLNVPFLGVSVEHESWVLSTVKLGCDVDGTPLNLSRRKAKAVEEIHYFGHYPVADLEYVSDCPLKLALRAWSPFLPGDVEASSVPVMMFELHLENPTDEDLTGVVAFSHPGPDSFEAPDSPIFEHETIDNGRVRGAKVTHQSGLVYALGVLDRDDVRHGGGLGMDGGSWSRIGQGRYFDSSCPLSRELPPTVNRPDSTLAVGYKLGAGESTVLRFVVAWYCPEFKGGGRATTDTNSFTHMYARTFGSVDEVLSWFVERHEDLLSRILAWQQVVYDEDALPVWLRESLVNVLHLITECAVWGQANPPVGDWCDEDDGLFAMNESPRGCPQMECMPCGFYGSFPLVLFFPELALSTLRGYKGYQFEDGQIPWVFGGCTVQTPPYELSMPSRGYADRPQTSLDGSCYASMAHRYWLRDRDPDFLKEFYESIKANTIFTMNLRPEAGFASVVSAPTGDDFQDWYEHVDMAGIIPHLGFVHLAHLRLVEEMAEAMEDQAFLEQCRKWRENGASILESETWNGDNYLLYHDKDKGVKSDVVMGYQLDGDWIARIHGVPEVVQEDRAKITRDTLEKLCVTSRGVITFVNRDRREFNPDYWESDGLHVPGTIMLAMLYLYHGNRELGLDLARRAMHSVVVENGASWDSPIVLSTGTGERLYGNDYYQNLILWAFPAAIAAGDFSALVQGDWIQHILKAASESSSE